MTNVGGILQVALCRSVGNRARVNPGAEHVHMGTVVYMKAEAGKTRVHGTVE